MFEIRILSKLFLKLKQVVCSLFLNIFFPSRDIQVLKICKLAKWWQSMMKKYDENMMKKDITANLYQKCLIPRSKILLDVFDKMNE